MANLDPPRMDPIFGIHAEALALQKRRMDVLAANIANADTPNYRARDIDFARALQQAQQPRTAPALLVTRSGHLPAGGSGDGVPELVYRVPLQPSADGNTVDTQVEQAQFADAALHYQASLSFLDGRLKSLLTAITGQ
jgi:flagellar basal-body rod protein FlgB